MTNFSIDKKLRARAASEPFELPTGFSERVDSILAFLPAHKSAPPRRHVFRRAAVFAAAVFAVAFILVPNVSPTVAQALSSVPVLGEIVNFITIRSYKYENDYHYADVSAPLLSSDETDAELSSSLNKVNSKTELLINGLIAQFEASKDEIGAEAHTGLYVGYDVLTNNARWFSMRIEVCNIAGSSDTYYVYYNIDMKTRDLVSLSSLFKDDGYISAISENIKNQMRERMRADSSLTYWVDSDIDPQWDFDTINTDQNFYITDNGVLVISFNKYDVAPGAMGCPEFEIPKQIYSGYLK